MRPALKHKERFAACAQALDRYLEEGVYIAPGAIREHVCPKCGRPYRPGSTTCAHCGSKKNQLRWLLSMLKPLLPLLLLSLLPFLVISLLGLISPAISKELVNGYLKNQSADASYLPGYLLVVLALLGVTVLLRLLSALRSALSAKIGSMAIVNLRSAVFEKVQNLSLAGVNKRTVGELMQRIGEDTAVIRTFLVSDLGDILEKVVTFAAIAVLLVWLDVQNSTLISVFIIIPAIPCLIAYRLFQRRIHRMFRAQWQVTARAGSVLHDIFSGIGVVKSYGREKDEIDRYDASITAVKKVQKRNELFWAVFSPMISFLITTGEFFVLFLVGSRILGGTMTFGDMTQYSAYASMIYTPLRSMAFIPRRVTRAMTSLSRIFDVMEDEDVLPLDPHPESAVLRGEVTLENVSFGYEAGKQVLKHIDLTVKPGEMIGLVGRSGVGKSTLVNLVMRLYDAEEGRVLLDGVDIRTLDKESLHRAVGAVLQDTFLFSGTIAANIAYAKPGATGEEIVAAAKLAGAHDFIMRLQDGYDTQVGEKGCTLSGGERQRIAIARALLHDPKILILDEATSALDTETEKQVQEALSKLIEGRTTIAIAHRLSTLRNATKIVVLDNKRIAEIGTHEELLRLKGIYYSLVMAQRQMMKKDD